MPAFRFRVDLKHLENVASELAIVRWFTSQSLTQPQIQNATLSKFSAENLT